MNNKKLVQVKKKISYLIITEEVVTRKTSLQNERPKNYRFNQKHKYIKLKLCAK
jgi:hypothetical protein